MARTRKQPVAPPVVETAPVAPPAAVAKPKVERKLTVVRVVEGRAYTYQNLGKGKIDVGDAVAKALRGLDLEGVYEAAAKALQTTPAALKAAYAPASNPGRQRMTLGNLMRLSTGIAWVAPSVREAARLEAKAAREAKWAAAKAEAAAKRAAREEAAALKAAAAA